MMIRIVLAAGLLAFAATASLAQGANGPASDSAAAGGAGIRSGNITSTGATVPNPGASQSGGTTSMDKGIQEHDNKVDSSICKGC